MTNCKVIDTCQPFACSSRGNRVPTNYPPWQRCVRYTWLALALLFMLLATLSGCQSPPQVTSPEALVLIKQVYTATNSRSVSRLEASLKALQELKDQNKLSATEIEAFEEILGMAQAGDWEQAQMHALQFADAQIR